MLRSLHRRGRGSAAAQTNGPVTPGDGLARVAAYAGVAGAIGYAALKLTWALGGTVMVPDPPPWEEPPPGSPWESVSQDGLLMFLAFEGTAILAVLAALILLSLVEPWGRALPRPALRVLAWLGFVLLTSQALVGAAGMVADALGLREENYTALSWYVLGCFSILGASFGIVAWRSSGRRESRRDRTNPAGHSNCSVEPS